MQYKKSLLSLLDSEWSYSKVKAIAFPMPPVPACGIMYPVQNWNSNTLDKLEQLYEGSSAVMTNKGPAVLQSYTLSDLIGNDDGNDEVVKPKPMYCATVSYIVKGTNEAVAQDVLIERMRPIGRSCHPGSHICVPAAPYLTAFLQMQCADGRGNPHSGFTFADDLYGENLYPRTDFTCNGSVDRLFQYLTLQDALGEDYDQVQWRSYSHHEYLTDRLILKISGAVESNSYVFASSPDISRAVAVIDKRNQLSSSL